MPAANYSRALGLFLVLANLPVALVIPPGDAIGALRSSGEWVFTGTPLPISHGRLLPMPDGTALLFGDTVQRYVPGTGTWEALGSLRTPRESGFAMTLLGGEILISGGNPLDGSVEATSAAELFDPLTGISSATGPMRFARTGHAATLLSSGKVLVSGGADAGDTPVGPAELYDPATGVWTLTGVLNSFRSSHSALLLPAGRVLVAGGNGLAEIYDIAAGLWRLTAQPDHPVVRAFLLADGRVLAFGRSPQLEITVELFDPLTETWTGAGTGPFVPLGSGLQFALLHDGSVLVAIVGGKFFGCSSATVRYDVSTNRWTTEIGGAAACVRHMVTLADGRALSVGPLELSSAPFVARLFRPDNSSPRLLVMPEQSRIETTPATPVEIVLAVENTGGDELSGSASTGPPLGIVSGGTFTLGPGAVTELRVRFMSAEFGTHAVRIDFMSNGGFLSVTVTAKVGVRLSGRITDEGGAGLKFVAVDLRGAESGAVITAAGGTYSAVVQPHTGYTLTPARAGFTFDPPTRSVLVSSGDATDLDFTGVLRDQVARFVGGFYEEVLGRVPDPGGLAGWTAFLRGHCNAGGVRRLANGFLDSEEFRTGRPLTLEGLVTLLYRTLLDRDPEAEGLTGWAGVFRQRRVAMARSFLQSPEFRNRLPDRTDRAAVTELVTRFYEEMLGRPPDEEGLDGWVGYVVATRDLENTAIAFVTSGEFESHALTFQEYVTILYRSLLGREADGGGLEGWERILRTHLLQVVNGGFIPSAEFQSRVPVVCR